MAKFPLKYTHNIGKYNTACTILYMSYYVYRFRQEKINSFSKCIRR